MRYRRPSARDRLRADTVAQGDRERVADRDRKRQLRRARLAEQGRKRRANRDWTTEEGW